MKNKLEIKIILSLCFVTMITAVDRSTLQSAHAFSWPCIDRSDGKAPIAVSDNNVYVAWWGNKTGNYEVMFKASNDGGQTFGDKINLSNSTNGTSVEADVLHLVTMYTLHMQTTRQEMPMLILGYLMIVEKHLGLN